MRYVWYCSRCAATYSPNIVRYTCPGCNVPAMLDMLPDYKRIGATWGPAQISADNHRSIWRYAPLLPLQAETVMRVSQCARDQLPWVLDLVGWTPLYQAHRLGHSLGLDQLLIKDDGRNPTGSLKDRASAVVLAKAKELGETTVATASSGNAAAALAGLAATFDMDCVIFVPWNAPEAKVAQLLIYGATVLLVQGSYDNVYDLCLAACAEWGWYCRNTGYNPHTTEGKKTCALEIVEQLGWMAPDTVLVSVGDGNIIVGLYRGFQDALALGWIERMPRLIGVQAAGAPALQRAWQIGAHDVLPAPAQTLADSINISLPRDGYRALQAVRRTDGMIIAVEEQAILEAIGRVARTTGIFVEPSAAVAFAGLFALTECRVIRSDERVVVVSTGNGLKDTRSAIQAVGTATVVAPNLAAVRRVLGNGIHSSPADPTS